MILRNGLSIPDRDELLEAGGRMDLADRETIVKRAAQKAAAWDLYELLESEKIPSGFLSIPHPWAGYSTLAAAEKAGKPFTCHPMFGHDIIYTHRANRGAAVGRTAERDFLRFASSVAGLEGGVYLSVGSAVMSPMIFEKALSMARNVAGGGGIRDCDIHVVDLQESGWDWSKGEPPMNDPAYYLRFMKTFNRMGMRTAYIQADNRDFFTALYQALMMTSPEPAHNPGHKYNENE
jgi:hypothetical protein